jgi:glycosyltransferase involved in cell wall biosynthesis
MRHSEPRGIGMILKGYPRISETFISNEILGLERYGFPIHIFSMRRPREPFTHESVRQIRATVDYLPETLLSPLPAFMFHNARVAARFPKRFVDAWKLCSIRFARTRKSATIKHLLQAGYLVDKLLPASGVTHFHAHFAHSPTSVAMFAGLLSGHPFSFTAHAKDIYTSDPRQLSEKIEKARFVVTCTEYNRRYLEALARGIRTPIHRLYHGIDVQLFGADRHDLNDPRPPYRLLTIARMTPKKGLSTVLEALAILKKRGIRFQYTLIGDGDDRSRVVSLIDSLGLRESVILPGTLPHGEVLSHFERSDLFVLGCTLARNGDRDGIPNVLVESMAVGVPVVATRFSAIPELVRDGITGILVSPENPVEMADAIMKGLTDTELRARFRTAARHRVESSFDNRRLIRELVEIYRKETDLPRHLQPPIYPTP